MSVTIYHNPRCTKSRQTLKLLRDHGIEPQIVEYLKTPPSKTELERILEMLGTEPREIMRKKEAPYKEQELGRKELGAGELLEAIVEHPVLLERPIVVVDDTKAAIGRPPENVLEIL